MKNSKTKDIDEWFAKKVKENPRRKTGAMAFIAIKDEVNNGLQAGYTKTVLFEYFTDTNKLSCCFETFLRYIRRYIDLAPSKGAKHISPQVSFEPISTPQDKGKSFKWDSVPNPDELY